jgi:3(or 17)beta-hydroxysteroid dehydrogenase
MGRLTGKVAIITGAAGGLGAAMCRRLSENGASVVVTDIRQDAIEQLAGEIGAAALPLVHDVTQEASWRSVFEQTIARFGVVDVLVNNAGIVHVGTVEDTSLDDFRRVNAIHSEGTFLGCKYALPAMRGTGDGSGSIINMSSVTAIGGFPYVLAYSAAKGAIRSMTKAIAAGTSAAGEPIRCNSVHPGRIDTEMVRECADDRARQDARIASDAGNPPGIPDDIAHLVVYLASDESAWMNGSELVVDNGATITDGRVQLRVRR